MGSDGTMQDGALELGILVVNTRMEMETNMEMERHIFRIHDLNLNRLVKTKSHDAWIPNRVPWGY